ncbi:DUF4436 family protein [Streptomyces narbonensis]|uniref:DUF4436 family protein n=1 Tax=Streptomyces narbonensis TaxID=67333 RepID=UPI0033F40DA1
MDGTELPDETFSHAPRYGHTPAPGGSGGDHFLPAPGFRKVLTLRYSRLPLADARHCGIAVWALDLSVLTGAWFLVTRRKGLTRAALGWMAATPFALAAFRNTAPGTPPIGCRGVAGHAREVTAR